jgi:hypothetical protein
MISRQIYKINTTQQNVCLIIWRYLMWNKPANQIPLGYAEVVGWKGRLPVGVDDTTDGTGAFVNPEFSPLTPANPLVDLRTPGRVGGGKKQTLTQLNLPNPHGVDLYGIKSDGLQTLIQGDANAGQPNLESQFLIMPANGNQPFSVLNPFRTVAFIEWVGI